MTVFSKYQEITANKYNTSNIVSMQSTVDLAEQSSKSISIISSLRSQRATTRGVDTSRNYCYPYQAASKKRRPLWGVVNGFQNNEIDHSNNDI
mmetsp:Transcript_21627/g.44603  ORF Transcript_21627/g.44603 Transcript_21627/m.44603 type:complete len:93 (-) Transcript_21627:2124-2402(-)